MAEFGLVIMGHRRRADMVIALNKQFNFRATEVWDELDDRWDTGRRALQIAARQGKPWSLVVQDDAILCNNFLEGAAAVLDACPSGPVSFYTGKTRPYASQVERAVRKAKLLGSSFIAMRGPLWGVAIAVPTEDVPGIVAYGDDHTEIKNYDIKISEFYHSRGQVCRYTLPSLVNHRVGPLNPSLVPGRGSGSSRVAHEFIGEADPLKINWHSGTFSPGDPSQPWLRRGDGLLACSGCEHTSEELPDMLLHLCQYHDIGQFDFLASNRETAEVMLDIIDNLPRMSVGKFFACIPDHDLNDRLKGRVIPIRRSRREKEMKRAPHNYTICGDCSDLLTLGPRAGYSLIGELVN